MYKVDQEQNEFNEALQEIRYEFILPKRLENSAVHKYYGIKQNKRLSAS